MKMETFSQVKKFVLHTFMNIPDLYRLSLCSGQARFNGQFQTNGFILKVVERNFCINFYNCVEMRNDLISVTSKKCKDLKHKEKLTLCSLHDRCLLNMSYDKLENKIQEFYVAYFA